jgi:thymidine kinase
MKVSLIYGCMFAGKTSFLIKEIRDRLHEASAAECLIIKHAIDNRYNSVIEVVSHSGDRFGAVPLAALDEIDLTGKKFIFVDEVQFFNAPNEIEDFLDRADYEGTVQHVYLAGLDRMYTGEYFAPIVPLLNDPDIERINLRAICVKCSSYANFTHRKIKNSSPILIGGEDLYEPLCQFCFQRTLEPAPRD